MYLAMNGFTEMLLRLWMLFWILWLPPLWASSIKIVATLPIFAQIASSIGGEHIQVDLLKGYPTDPHYFNMTPNQMHHLFEADYIIGPIEIIQRLPMDPSKKIDVSLAFSHPALQNSLARGRLIAIAIEDEPLQTGSLYNPLQELTHEWMSFDALEVLADLLMETYSKADSMNAAFYRAQHKELVQGLHTLFAHYSTLKIEKLNLFYHNDFWILEQELHTNFGPALYSCEESGLSPQLQTLLSTESQNYKSFIVDSSIPLSTISRITKLLHCPIRQVETLGSSSKSTLIWLDTVLQALYT
jgi:ABC-type Zn uptake system ZnuABC Zn-binding protein ZnuA